MTDGWAAAAVFGVGACAGMLNVLAGGGSALSLALLLFFGLDGATANGTNRVALLCQNVVATAAFAGRREALAMRVSWRIALVALPGALLGAGLALRIDDLQFRRLLGGVMILILLSLLLPHPSARRGQPGRVRRVLFYPAIFLAGCYGGFIQAGVGFLLMAALHHLGGLDLVEVNAQKVFIVLVYTLPVLFLFGIGGHLAWDYAVALALGNMAGAWGAARLSLRGGERIVRYGVAAALLLTAVKLLR